MTSRPSDPRPRPTDPRSRPASLPVGYDGRASSVLPSPTARYPPPRDEQRVQQHQHQPPRRIDDGRSRTSGLINADRPQPYYVSPSPSPAPPAATSPLPAFWQVHPRRRLTADEAFARQAALRRPRRDTAEKRFASLPVEVALRIAYYALRWTGDASYEVGTVSSIFDATRDAKRFSLVSKAWRVRRPLSPSILWVSPLPFVVFGLTRARTLPLYGYCCCCCCCCCRRSPRRPSTRRSTLTCLE
jgi:hypothetical protein